MGKCVSKAVVVRFFPLLLHIWASVNCCYSYLVIDYCDTWGEADGPDMRGCPNATDIMARSNVQ